MKHRQKRGGTIVEFACVLAIGGPLLIMLIFAAVEAAHFFTCKSAIDLACRNAARGLVVAYNNSNPTIETAGVPNASNSTTFCDQNFQIPNYVVSGAGQWSVVWDTANNPPQWVEVSCTYPMVGNSKLQPIADPVFHIGSSFVLTSTFKMPVQ